MKPSETKSFNSFIVSFLSEDASSTIAPQGKATPKAGSVDAEETDSVNDVIAKAIEAGRWYDNQESPDAMVDLVGPGVKEMMEGDDEDDKEVKTEAEEDDKEDKKVDEAEEDDKEEKEPVKEAKKFDPKKVFKKEDADEDGKEVKVDEAEGDEEDKEVKTEAEEDFQFSQADLDDLEADLDDEDEIKEDGEAFNPWPMRVGKVAEGEEDSEEDKEKISEEDEEDKKEVSEGEEDDKEEKKVDEAEEDDKEIKEDEEELKKDDEEEKNEDADEDGKEVELPKLESEDEEEEKLKVESDIKAILSGNENLSEEQIAEKSKAIFESAVKHRVNRYINKLNKIFRHAVMTENKKTTARWSKSLDRYFDHVVTEWKKENAVPLKRAISNDLTESIALDITKILKKRGVLIPENKVDLVKKTLEEKTELEKKLNESTKREVALKESNEKAKNYLRRFIRRSAIAKAVAGLNEADRAKVLPVIKQISFKNEKDFLDRAKVIRESYVTKTKVKTATIVESKITNSPVDKAEEQIDPVVAAAIKGLSKTIK